MIRLTASTVLVSIATSASFAGRARLIVLYPPPGYSSVEIADITPDGWTLVGVASWGEGFERVTTPFWWDQQHGYQLSLPLSPTQAVNPQFTVDRVSADGSTIVGHGTSVQGTNAVLRWRRNVATPEILKLATFAWFMPVWAAAVSDDGSLAGHCEADNSLHFYVGRSTVWPSAEPLAFAAKVVVADGWGMGNDFTVVGTMSDGQVPTHFVRAFRHVPASGQTQAYLPPQGPVGEEWQSEALCASPSGQVVAGLCGVLPNSSLVRWDSINSSAFDLECPAWTQGCTLLGVSDTSGMGGPITVGWTQNQTATFWRPDGRAEALWGFLVNQGERLHPQFQPRIASAITGNGRMIVGTALVPPQDGGIQVGFMATLGTPCVADIDDGSGLGMPDDAVTIGDLLQALAWFEAGDIRFDIDNGERSGTRDDAVTIDDLLFFLAHFESGC